MTTKSGETGTLGDLRSTLIDAENELLKRKVARLEKGLDDALEIVNHAADIGAIEIDCTDCDGDGDGSGGGDGGEVEGSGDE